jgi:conjugal transfer/entry exclusion protein
MTEVLTEAGVGPNMINTQQTPDVDVLKKLVPFAVTSARDHLEKRRDEYDAKNAEPLEAARSRLDSWQQLSLEGVAVPQRGRAEARVTDTVEQQQRLLDSLRSTGEPLLRVLAVLVDLEGTRA